MTQGSAARPALLAILAFAASLSAQADQGFYLGAIAGASLGPDPRITASDAAGNTATDTVALDVGPAGSVVAGYTFGNGLRAELEGGYRRADVSGGGGDTRTSQVLASAYYNVSRNGYFFYLGGGGGYANVRLGLDGIGRDDDGMPVWTLGSGFGLPVGRQWMVGIDYRYVAAFERGHYGYVVNDEPVAASFRYRSHFVGLGLRYSFGSALADSHPVRRPSEPVSVVPGGN